MPLASNIEIGNVFRGLFVGESGSGKTPSACSFLDAHPTKPIKVFDFDGRMASLLNTPWIDRSRVDFTYYHALKEPGANGVPSKSTYEQLKDDLVAMRTMLKMNMCDFNTIIVDGLPATAFAFIQDILPVSHNGTNADGRNKGRKLGSQLVAGPDDYFYESNGIHTIIAILKTIPIQNIIVTCHIIDEWDKEDPENPMSRSIKVSEKLAIRNKLAMTVPGQFDHIFRFHRKVYSGGNHITCTFWSDICRTVYPNLPFEDVDITGKSFYKVLMEYAKLQTGIGA